jgi:hypothetical protein
MKTISKPEAIKAIHDKDRLHEIERKEATADAQLAVVERLLVSSKEFPVRYNGVLGELALKALKENGWLVINTFKAHRDDGPGTMPTYDLSPLDI